MELKGDRDDAVSNTATGEKFADRTGASVVQHISELTLNLETWIAVAAVTVSIVSFLLAMYSASLQRKHNRLSVLPIADIVFGDYENSVFVKISNVGLGPMLIEKLEVRKSKEWQNTALVDFMPHLPEGLSWSDFTGRVDNIWLQPNGEISLVELSGRTDSPQFIRARDDIRKVLGAFELRVSYRDAYKHKLPKVSRKLDWFRRS